MKWFLVLICLLAPLSESVAAMAPPMEDLLLRAQIVVVAQVVSVTENSATFHPVQLLRGEAHSDITLAVNPMFSTMIRIKVGAEILLLSQGDDRFGKPQPIIDRPMEGQTRYCGWIALPLSKDGDETYAEMILSFVDGEPSVDAHPGKLGLELIQRLIKRFPYNPHINDDA